MAAGIPLTDADRWPWLERLRQELAGGADVVVTCSALKRSYRDVLRGAGGVRFVFLDLAEPLAEERAATRSGHFMGAGLVPSQFSALERPGPDEDDVVLLDAGQPVELLVPLVVQRLGADPAAPSPP
jgi:gluconokinase